MIYLLLLACGALSGFLAGLLGIGGGFVVVPILQVLLPRLGFDPALVPLVSVATSLAAMVPTAASAVLAQHRRRALRAEWVRLLAPGVALGSAVGSLGAASIGGAWITLVFALYATAFSLKLLFQRESAAIAAPAPTRAGRFVLALPQWSVGVFIGGFASLAGVGGASLVMSYLMSRRAEMHQATAATSAVGLVIALVGAAGFGAAGFGVPGFGLASAAALAGSPSGLVGFVFWPAALAIGAAAIVLAPIGVAAAHRLPVCTLKQVFAVLLLLLAGVALARAFV